MSKNNNTLYNVIAYLLMLFANISDVLTTIMALELGGSEGNPFAQALLQTFGYDGLWGMKLTYMGAYAFATAKSQNKLKTSLVGSAIVFGVVIWNIIMILRLLH